VAGGLQLTVGSGTAVALVLKQAVGQQAACALVEREKGEGDLGAPFAVLLVPGNFAVLGKAKRGKSGNSTCTMKYWAWMEAVGAGLELLAHGGQVLQALLQPEVGQIFGAVSLRKKVETLSYCLTKACLATRLPKISLI